MSGQAPLPFSGDATLAPGRNAGVRYRIADEVYILQLDEPDRPRSAHGLRATWHWQAADGGYHIWVEIAHDGDAPVHLEAIDVLTAPIPDLGTPPHTWSVYQHGWGSWTPVFARHLDKSLYTEPGTADYRRTHQPHLKLDSDEIVASEWVTVIASRVQGDGARAFLAGFVTTKDQLAEIRVQTDGSALVARCTADGVILAPGESFRSEVLLVKVGPDPLELLEAWAEAAGREMAARVSADIPTGWCTWYYFYGKNTADHVLGNVVAIGEHDLPLDVILLDDGYQTAIGDWLSIDREKFPDGMEPVAAAIRQAGHRLGIWTAPFGAEASSRLLSDHPDWFLQTEEGQPVIGWNHNGRDCYALDCTHPQVLEWLGRIFRTMRSEWGVDFFKIDFVFAGAHPGRRHDAAATRAQAVRRGIEAIRQAIGDDAYLLGCGAPMGPCIGVVDGMRVGPDVDPNWHPLWRHDLSMPSTESALRNAVTRAPFHGRLWANDPDCLLVRQRGDEMDLVLNEMRTLAALVALLGGLTLDSDNLLSIRPGRLKYLLQTLPPTGVSARPLDLFQNELPRVLLLPVERAWGRWWVAGLVNWNDETERTTVRLDELGLPPGRYHVFHYWRQRYLGLVDESVTVRRHQPHETAVLLFKPATDRPDLLTTTFHVCQGAMEIANYRLESIGPELEIEVVLEKDGTQFGDVFFTVPAGWQVQDAQVDGVSRTPRSVAPGIVALGLTLQGRAEIVISFAQAEL